MKSKYFLLFITVFILFLVLCFFSFAHSGKTDENGGHYDYSTGEYHYHHGYPAHQHINGECPYNFVDNTVDNYYSGDYETSTYSSETSYAENYHQDGYDEGYNTGYDEGFSVGYLGADYGYSYNEKSRFEDLPLLMGSFNDGYHDGYKSGYRAGYKEGIEEFNNITESTEKRNTDWWLYLFIIPPALFVLWLFGIPLIGWIIDKIKTAFNRRNDN